MVEGSSDTRLDEYVFFSLPVLPTRISEVVLWDPANCLFKTGLHLYATFLPSWDLWQHSVDSQEI